VMRILVFKVFERSHKGPEHLLHIKRVDGPPICPSARP
jgi:hypothetical protein